MTQVLQQTVAAMSQDLIPRTDPVIEYTEIDYILSPKLFIETFFWVKNSDPEKGAVGELVPFVFSHLQNEYYNYLMTNHYRPYGEPVDGIQLYRLQGIRDIHLKHRQWGLSTLLNALYSHDTWVHPNTETIIYCQDSDFSADMLEKWEIFYENLPMWFKPDIGRNRKGKQMAWPGIGSKVKSGTPGVGVKTSRKQGRSKTLFNVLCSEFTDWANQQTTLSGLEDAVPLTGNIVIEATARVMGDTYHVMYENSNRVNPNDYSVGPQPGKTRSAWTGHFTPWFANPARVIPQTKAQGLEIISSLTSEEKLAVKKHMLTVDQLAWRRQKISSKNNNLLDFLKENPENDVDCFASAAPMIFPRWLHKKTCIQRPARRGHVHSIGVDTALGVKGGDNAAIEVIDGITQENVFSFHSNTIPPDMLALIAYEVWLMYPGIVLIESNSYGQATLQKAYEMDWTRFLFSNSDSHGGWYTNGKNKSAEIFRLKTSIGNKIKGQPGLAIGSDQFVRELMWFQRSPGSQNKMGAPSTKDNDGNKLTDDSIMAMMMAHAGTSYLEMLAEPFAERFGNDYLYEPVGEPFWADPVAWLERQNMNVSYSDLSYFSSSK